MGPRGAAVPRLPFPLMQSPGNYPNPAPGWCRGTDVTARERRRGTRGRHGHKAGTGAVAPAHAAGTGTRGGAGGAVCSPSAAAPALPWRGTGAAGGSCGRWGARGTTGCLIMALPLAPPRVRHPDPCPAAAQGSAWTPPARGDTGAPDCHLWCGLAFSQQNQQHWGQKPGEACGVRTGSAETHGSLQRLGSCIAGLHGTQPLQPSFGHGKPPRLLACGDSQPFLLPPPPAPNPQCRAQEPAGASTSEPRAPAQRTLCRARVRTVPPSEATSLRWVPG